MKKMLMMGAMLLFVTANLSAQKRNDGYTTAVGVKFYPTALSIKHFIKDGHALEGLGYFSNTSFRITGLYEVHKDLNVIDGLRWYYGAGAHIGFYKSKYNGGTGIGVDGVLGLDFQLGEIPLDISIDWQPSFEFGDSYGNGFTGNWGGIGIRYILN